MNLINIADSQMQMNFLNDGYDWYSDNIFIIIINMCMYECV